jgi:hypothetical protein
VVDVVDIILECKKSDSSILLTSSCLAVDMKVLSWNRCTVYNVYVPSGLYLFTIFHFFFSFSPTATRSPTLNSFCIPMVT